jgi:hypothetical protein
VEVHHGTLRLYLDGARDLPHYERDYTSDGGRRGRNLYPKHAIVATVVYRTLDGLSLRGEETFYCPSRLVVKHFHLRLYGESTVEFTAVNIDKMHTAIYGESALDIRSGTVSQQYYTCYGDGKINTTAIRGQEAKVTSFGDSEFNVNVSDRIRIVAFGDAKVAYRGNPDIVKGIHFGDVQLQRLD